MAQNGIGSPQPGSGIVASTSSSDSRVAQLTPQDDSDDPDLGALDEDYQGIELKQQGRENWTRSDRPDDANDNGIASVAPRRNSSSTTHSFQLYTPDEERAVIRKFDRKLVLFVSLLYMLSFLDRSSMQPAPTALPVHT